MQRSNGPKDKRRRGTAVLGRCCELFGSVGFFADGVSRLYLW
jgi:hypothetical protein